jgi:hypothetical protein
MIDRLTIIDVDDWQTVIIHDSGDDCYILMMMDTDDESSNVR